MDFQALHFLRPLWLVPLPVLALLWWRARHAFGRSGKGEPILASHLQLALTLESSRRTAFTSIDTQALTITFLLLAAAGPSSVKEASPWFSEDAPLVAAIEVSDSMRANDLSPTRLARARFKLLDLLELRTGARTAVLAYAGSAHVVLPPSADLNAIKPLLESLDPNIMPEPGARARAVLQPAKDLLGEYATRGTILFLSDGFDALDIEPLKAFSQESDNPALAAFIIGSAEGGLALMPDGSPARTARGSRIDTRVDMAVLQRLEREAGLPVTRITTDDSDLKELIRVIESNLAKAEDPEARWRDDGWWLLWPAGLLLLLNFRRGWTGRP
ncbi:MAG: VWA domain-containing protein [Pseudomonadota bacterium]